MWIKVSMYSVDPVLGDLNIGSYMRHIEDQYEILDIPDHFSQTPVDRIEIDWQGLILEYKIDHSLSPVQKQDSINASVLMGVTASAVFSIAMAFSVIVMHSL